MSILSIIEEGGRLIVGLLRDSVRTRAQLVAENLALRQQLAVLSRTQPRPKIQWRDRWFWMGLMRAWSGWRSALTIVRPETVIRWHRAGFIAHWRRKSTRTPGRPSLRAQASERTVSRYLATLKRPAPSERQRQSWRTFLENHRESIAAMDFLSVPTASFRTLYVWFAIEHGRRSILHFGVTDQPTAEWVAQSLRETFPFEATHRYLISDNDPVFRRHVPSVLQSFGIRSKKTTPRSPWQNGIAERWVGTVRRELLDHVIVLNERHLLRLVTEYVRYYNEDRCHLTLGKDAPKPRPTERGPPDGEIIALPRLGGLQHRYTRKAA